MVVPGSGLKPLQHLDHIGQVSGLDQAVVHGKVLDFCVHTRLAGFEQIIRNVNLVRVGDGRKREFVLFIKCQQRVDMALLGHYNVDEGAYGAERIDDLSVGVPGLVFVQQGFIQHLRKRSVLHVGGHDIAVPGISGADRIRYAKISTLVGREGSGNPSWCETWMMSN